MMNLRFYRELDRLQDSRDFGEEWDVEPLLGCLAREAGEETDCRMVLLNRLEAEMRYTNRRSVYVALKCLIFLHQLVRMGSGAALHCAARLLDQMTTPSGKAKIDQYITKKLLNPYRQYLKRLALRALEEPQGCKLDAELQAYSEFNFANSALSEFTAPIREFTAFFAHQYPCLNAYIPLLSRDLAPIYRTVLEAFQENVIGQVTFIEVERMGAQMAIFSSPAKAKELQRTADTTNSSGQHRQEPVSCAPITPFFSLESSNLSLVARTN